MLYDNIYYLGQLFQLFWQDVLASGEVSRAGADARLGSDLLAWLERRNIVLDSAHQATLLQMASTFTARTSTCDASQALTQPCATGSTPCF